MSTEKMYAYYLNKMKNTTVYDEDKAEEEVSNYRSEEL